jgi:hypothetical protein
MPSDTPTEKRSPDLKKVLENRGGQVYSKKRLAGFWRSQQRFIRVYGQGPDGLYRREAGIALCLAANASSAA